jgi:hypothetical protein
MRVSCRDRNQRYPSLVSSEEEEAIDGACHAEALRPECVDQTKKGRGG